MPRSLAYYVSFNAVFRLVCPPPLPPFFKPPSRFRTNCLFRPKTIYLVFVQVDKQDVFCIHTPAYFLPVQSVFQCCVNMTVGKDMHGIF